VTHIGATFRLFKRWVVKVIVLFQQGIRHSSV
jgi:hypothetical protein